MAQMLAQLQAQSQQLQGMLNNPALPAPVRQQAQMKQQQLQLEIQNVAAMAAAQQSFAMNAAVGVGAGAGVGVGVGVGMGGMGGGAMMGAGGAGGVGAGGGGMGMGQWTNPFPNQQPAGQDSAYQRLPLNNRRRPLKRDRPSDFLEIGGAQGDAKTPRYWE